jgi:glucose-1-phosphate thymidylyltransferase
MKALVLAAGKGARLKPVTNNIAKHLIPIANKPMIFYVLEQIREAGIQDAGIVISPDTGKEIREVVGTGERWGLNIQYILQPQPQGIAHAVKTGRDFLGNEPFLLFLGDNLIKEGIKGIVSRFILHPSDALVVLKSVEDPRAFGVAEIDINSHVIKVLEKPSEPKSKLAIVGVYIFSPVVHSIIDGLKPSGRGEYEITDAIQKLLEDQYTVDSYVLEHWWMDTGRREDLLAANKTILDENMTARVNGTIDEKCLVKGVIDMGQGTIVQNSYLKGPISIGSDCRIVNSFLGPHVSIGNKTNVENVTIRDSIVMDNVYIKNVPVIFDSIIGRNVTVTEGVSGYAGTKLFVGDSARVEL